VITDTGTGASTDRRGEHHFLDWHGDTQLYYADASDHAVHVFDVPSRKEVGLVGVQLAGALRGHRPRHLVGPLPSARAINC